MDKKIVVKIDLHGELILTAESGESLDAEIFIESLKNQGSLQQVIAIVWVPTQLVLLNSIFVPGKRKADWFAALPYALEELLSEPVENFHIVALNRTTEGMVSAGLVTHTVMQNWIKVLERYGLEHAALIADCFSVPRAHTPHAKSVASPTVAADKEHWNIYTVEGLRIVRKDQYSGFSGSAEWLDEIRALAAGTNESHLPELHEVSKQRDSSSRSLRLLSAFNLRTDVYAPINDGHSILQYWKWHLILLLFVVVTFIANTYLQTQRLQEQVADYKNQTEVLFKQLFPDVKKVINIRVQTQNRITQVDSSVAIGPSQLVNEIENAFKLFPTVNIQKIQWSQKSADSKKEGSGRLTIQVLAPKSQALEILKERLQKEKVSGVVSLEIKNVTPTSVEGVFYVDAN